MTPARSPSTTAGTRTRSARWAWGTARAVPCSTPAVAARARRRRPGGRCALAATSVRAADSRTSPATTPGSQRSFWAGRAEAGQGQGAEDGGGPQRDGGHGPALLLEDEADLGQAQTRSAVLLGDGQAEEVRPGQLGPQLVVEPVVGAARSRPPGPGSTMPSKTEAAASATACCSSVKAKSIRPPPRSSVRSEHGRVSSSSTATNSTTTGMPMRDVVGVDADQVGHQARALLELDHGDGQGVVEARDLGMVDDDVAVDGARARWTSTVSHSKERHDGAGRAGRVAQDAAGGAALDEQLCPAGRPRRRRRCPG